MACTYGQIIYCQVIFFCQMDFTFLSLSSKVTYALARYWKRNLHGNLYGNVQFKMMNTQAKNAYSKVNQRSHIKCNFCLSFSLTFLYPISHILKDLPWGCKGCVLCSMHCSHPLIKIFKNLSVHTVLKNSLLECHLSAYIKYC